MGLFDIFSDADAKKASADATNALNAGKTEANGALDAAQAQANPLFDKAYAPFADLIAKSGKGLDALNDATGANGADGLARARALFQADPGYSGGLNTGVDALNRTAAARGDTGGNNSADILKFASDYDAQKYGSYVGNLAPYLGGAISAANGGAGVLTGQAGADLGVGSQKANIASGTASGIADAQSKADLAGYNASSNFFGALLGGGALALKASGVGGFAPGGR